MTTPRARRTDSDGSHAAAAHSAAKATSQKAIVLQAVRDCPGETSAEIALRIGMDRVDCARRCSDLRSDAKVCNGKKRRCTVARCDGCLTWYPAQAPAVPQQLFDPSTTLPRRRRPRPATLADLPAASPPPTMPAAADSRAAELLEWFRRSVSEAGTLPSEPFELRPGERVSNPAMFYAALQADISAGPTATYRAQQIPAPRWAPLLADLQRLKTITEDRTR